MENSYASPRRQGPRPGSATLVVVDEGIRATGIAEALSPCGRSGKVTAIGCDEKILTQLKKTSASVLTAADIVSLPDGAFADIIYAGANAEVIEALCGKLATEGAPLIVTGVPDAGGNLPVIDGEDALTRPKNQLLGRPAQHHQDRRIEYTVLPH